MHKNTRIFQYDLMRVLVMFMVLMLHVELQTRTFKEPYNLPWTVSTLLSLLLINSNALFFMMSGKFNLDKGFHCKKDYVEYYIKKISTIVLPFVFISFCIFVYYTRNLNVIDFILAFIDGKIEAVYWFLYNLIGILMISPFLSKLVYSMKLWEKKILFSVLFVLESITFCFILLKVNTTMNYSKYILLGWCYYYISGYIIEDIFKSKNSRIVIIILGGMSFLVSFILIRNEFMPFQKLKQPNPLMFLQSLSIFFLMKDCIHVKGIKFKKIVCFVAKQSYMIYLVHFFIITNISTLFDLEKNFFLNVIYGLIILALAFALSLFVSWILNKFVFDRINKKIMGYFKERSGKYV